MTEPASLVHPSGDPLNPVALAYDPAGRLSRIDFPNAVATDVTYDAAGRPASIVHAQAPTELAWFDYNYFADGSVQSITEAGGTRSFDYDATPQVTAGGFAAAPESYSYDTEGNRIASHLSTAHVHDAANRLLEDDAFCYAYDANGNLTTRTEKAAGACISPTTTYSWDVRNRLVRIDFPDLTFAAYRYDGDGRRIAKDVNGTLTHYVYDDDDILLEYDGAASLLARYGHGLEVDQPLVMEQGGESYYYQTDHLGSVRLLTDAVGMAANRYDYDAFGGAEPTTVAALANPYAFTARERDAESRLQLNRARYYRASIGRFVTEDPIGFAALMNGRLNVHEKINLYHYALNNPLVYIDPYGESVLKAYAVIVTTTTGAILGHIASPGDPCSIALGAAVGFSGGLLAVLGVTSIFLQAQAALLGGVITAGLCTVS